MTFTTVRVIRGEYASVDAFEEDFADEIHVMEKDGFTFVSAQFVPPQVVEDALLFTAFVVMDGVDV